MTRTVNGASLGDRRAGLEEVLPKPDAPAVPRSGCDEFPAVPEPSTDAEERTRCRHDEARRLRDLIDLHIRLAEDKTSMRKHRTFSISLFQIEY
jgi:hypothetical protein